jgi:uncharacterized protein (TIGR03435 family)
MTDRLQRNPQVIDDWAMAPRTEPERRDFWEICEDRYQIRSLILMSVAGYSLTLAKGGIKATPSDPSRHSGGNGGRGFIDSTGSRLSALTIRLSALLGRPVVDMTGDNRKFDLHLRWTPDDAQTGTDSAAPDRPSLFTPLQEQRGLKLESGKVPADVLVVDHAELPTDNQALNPSITI